MACLLACQVGVLVGVLVVCTGSVCSIGVSCCERWRIRGSIGGSIRCVLTIVGVSVAVNVGVIVGVLVGVSVGVLVGVLVGGGVLVGKGVLVEVGSGTRCDTWQLVTLGSGVAGTPGMVDEPSKSVRHVIYKPEEEFVVISQLYRDCRVACDRRYDDYVGYPRQPVDQCPALPPLLHHQANCIAAEGRLGSPSVRLHRRREHR